MLYKAKFSKTDKKLNREIIDTYSQIIAAEKYASVGPASQQAKGTWLFTLCKYMLMVAIKCCYILELIWLYLKIQMQIHKCFILF